MNKKDLHSFREKYEQLRNQGPCSTSHEGLCHMMIHLFTVIESFLARVSLSSETSHKPPSTDLYKKKKKKDSEEAQKDPSSRKQGAQKEHPGKTLMPFENPDHIVLLEIDRNTFSKNSFYHHVGYEKRQVVDIKLTRVVTEYQAEIWQDEQGQRYRAEFPQGVTAPVQYGSFIKAHSVYMSQYNLIPFKRLSDYFKHELGIPLSTGSIFNFNKEAFHLLEGFSKFSHHQMKQLSILHVDETGININGKRFWLHVAGHQQWSYLAPHQRRGCEAINEIGILPHFQGTAIHDHWKPYLTYKNCDHGLCNAHHIRELQWVIDNQPSQKWAQSMQKFLLDLSTLKKEGNLKEEDVPGYQEKYRTILKKGLEEIENQKVPTFPEDITITTNETKSKRKSRKKSKEHNLLKRLEENEDKALRFITNPDVPFTNNLAENDIRMTKVHQKISGCFRSFRGAEIFCRIRSYILTARKHGASPSEALRALFEGQLSELARDWT